MCRLASHLAQKRLDWGINRFIRPVRCDDQQAHFCVVGELAQEPHRGRTRPMQIFDDERADELSTCIT